MIILKNAKDVAAMRESGRIAAAVRDKVAAEVRPGVATIELGDYAARLMEESGARSAFLGYHGFPGQICVSVNETVVHGIPGGRRIEIGDIVSIDVGVSFRGYIGDTATTVMVGVTDPDTVRLVMTARSALETAIQSARRGGRLSDISHAVEKTAVSGGFSVVRQFVGHGIGKKMHEDPQVPNYGDPGRGPVLRKGMTLAVEPMLNAGSADVRVERDGWTVVTADGKRSAHFEHTIAIGETEAEVLTA